MTTRHLDALNRRTRIIEAARAGIAYQEIAHSERVGHTYVSRVAIKAGIRRQAEHRRSAA